MMTAAPTRLGRPGSLPFSPDGPGRLVAVTGGVAACAADLVAHGPAGGPAMSHHPDYAWLHTTRAGRAALWVVAAGLGMLTLGVTALLPVLVDRRPLLADGGIR